MYNEYNMGIPNYMPRRGINWNSILNNTQRTLGIINQAIPIVYQVKPLLNNARTLFRVASAINSNDDETNDTNSSVEKTDIDTTDQEDEDLTYQDKIKEIFK